MIKQKIEAVMRRCVELRGADPAPKGILQHIERELEVVLPYDLKKITSVYCGGMLGAVEQYALEYPSNVEVVNAGNIINVTLRMRKNLGLPHRYVVLAEPDEGFIVLETKEREEESAPVISVNAVEASGFTTGEPFTHPEVYESYTDFFAHLIEVEEEIQE